MDFNLGLFVLENLEAAGVIGGYVAISIISFSLIIFASRGKIEGSGQCGPKYLQPIIGALLGVIPGCGATIIASTMYKNGKISFGGLFAAFITTLGEGSFVLLGASAEADVASNLKAFAIVNLVGCIVGIIFGYIADFIGYEMKPKNISENAIDNQKEHSALASNPIRDFIEGAGFYLLLALGVFLLPGSIMALWGGGISSIEGLTVWVTILFSLISIIYYLSDRFLHGNHDCSYKEDVRSTLAHSVADISLVTTFVFLGLFVANFVIDVLVGAEVFNEWMTSSAFSIVLIAALIGVTPGCGGMIAVAAAYITIDNFPIAALIAAAIATSGDGIFPLLAANKKEGIIISAAGLLIAVLVGLLILGF